nr:MAG TPA: hypothetical protein [Caudoviricetes sp.]
MEGYINELHTYLESLSKKPLTLGRIEEADAVAGLLHRLDQIGWTGNNHARLDSQITNADAMRWEKRMQNADGTTGPHWTMEQTTAVAESQGIQETDIPRWAWGVALNMMYSDYLPVAEEYGLNRPDFYAALAKAFLLDKDGPGPEEKLCAYFTHVVG